MPAKKSRRPAKKPSPKKSASRSTATGDAGAKKILEAARRNFGFESLRPGQQEAVEALLGKHDTLVVMPTGSGKSAIYQIAGSLMKGATLVISPLIALQKDQVDSINSQ